ncbi:MAG: hypothetical protein MPN21_20185 [Thermoanaerobaculia bacterium]|nr:hypothetical protein [Thermoanaerobaculia bacterium]
MSDRKYRQRGYQDDKGDHPGNTAPAGHPRRRDPTLRPAGRGLGAPTATIFRCRVCGKENPVKDLAPESACTHCGADLHSCTHCSLFDTSATNQCREPKAQLVRSKATRNQCGHFKVRRAREFAKETNSPRDAKAAFDALFDL